MEPNWLITLLVVMGGLLFTVEFFAPGMILGLAGAACWIAAVGVGFSNYGPFTGLALLAGILALGVVGTLIWLRHWPKTRLARAMTLEETNAAASPVDAVRLLHQSGITLTQCRPAGTALIGKTRCSVVSESTFLEKDVPVRVVAVEGTRIVVRPVSS